MRVKICGITNFEDAFNAINFGADALGFIFYKKSKRYIAPEEAEYISKRLPPFVTKVGVFVDEDFNTVNKISNLLLLNYVQLHGHEEVEYIKKIETPVIKALRIKGEESLKEIEKYKAYNLLLDSYSKSDYGGTGKTFDWKLLKKIKLPYILSGGISLENIDYIYNNIRPLAIDLSSSIERSPGEKDLEKMKLFFNKLNRLRYDANINES